MTDFHVEVVRLGKIEQHPNADSLGITMVRGGFPVIVKLGEYAEGDLAVYVPVESVVPEGDPRWEFLGEHRRIRAKRLRGTFSMGLLTRADPSWPEGKDVSSELRITKYDPPEPVDTAAAERDPGLMPVYDVEGLRRWPDVLKPGEEVVITEKLEGENARFVHDGTRLWVASKTLYKARGAGSRWWQIAEAMDLESKLARVPNIAIYGEAYGYTGGFGYDVAKGQSGLRVFDALDVRTRVWLDPDDLHKLVSELDLKTVPLLHRGPWSRDLYALADGPSTLAGHVREGFVVRPVHERVDPELGRVILKLKGEGYLLRRNG